MTVESYVVAEMLQRLEQQHALLRPQSVELVTAISKDDYPMARETSEDLFRVLESFTATTDALRGHVVAHDGIGGLCESLDELALRARALVIVVQLGLLREELEAPAAKGRARGWFIGRCHEFSDVTALVNDRIAAIHALWLPYRKDKPQPSSMTDADRKVLYRTTLRVAQRELKGLSDEPELARLLEHGVAALDLVQVHLACKQIAAVLNLTFDSEPTPAGGGRKPRRLAGGSSDSST